MLVVIGGLAWSAASGRPAAAQHPRLFGGSLVLGDARPLTVINVATAEITVRLEGVNAQVGAANYGDILPVAVNGGTMLINRVSGSFNFLGSDDYVTDPHGPGVSLGPLPSSTGAVGLAVGSDAFVLRAGPRSTVSLVGPQTVAQAARLVGANAGTPTGVSPLGSASTNGFLDLNPGGSTVAGGSLWALYRTGNSCQSVEMTPVATSRSGLVVANRVVTGSRCGLDAIESDGDTVGLASRGEVQLMSAATPAGSAAPPVVVNTPFTASADSILPVTGATDGLWYLARSSAGWQLFGVQPSGRTVGPYALAGFGPGSAPAVPVLSQGFLYTLDQNQSYQPTLWTIDVANGRMAPLAGTSHYPVIKNTEKAGFHGVQVLLDGPRVVFNNPQSLEAVVVFTDSSRLPAVVNKSLAVSVSATGPADLNAIVPPTQGKGATKPTPRSNPVPVVQPVSQQITCATTTQKPYAPQITTLTPSSSTVTVAWGYQLLDQTDCEPDSWAVEVTALTGGHQPAHPIQFVTGQNQYIFSGLRPTTTYQIVVTAYINNQSTPSNPATFVTSARGPDAPLSVTTMADGLGDWVVSWTPCTEAANPNCVVPAATWSVIGSSCGGNFVGTPPTVQVSGDKYTATINADQLQLLGDSLSFSVQGSLPSGLTGNPTSDSACTQAWEKPTASEISLQSQVPPPANDVVSATLQAVVSGNLATLLGAHKTEVEFVYSLAGQKFGPTNATSAQFTNIPAGQTFTPFVTVYPAGHPEASVTVAGQLIHQTIPWPSDLAGGTTATGAVDPQNPNQGTVTVTFPADLPSGPLTVTSPDPSTSPTSGPVLQCGGASGATYTYPIAGITNRTLTIQMDDQAGDNLVVAGGNCALRFTVTDNASPNPYGVPSSPIEADFTIGQEPAYAFQQAYAPQCAAGPNGDQCGPGGQPWQLVVSSTSPSLAAGGNWSVTAELRDQQTGNEITPDPCRVTTNLSGPAFPVTITLPVACDPDLTPNIDVLVSFEYIGHTFTVDAGYPTNRPGSNVPIPTTTTSTSTTTTVPGNQNGTQNAAAAGASGLGILGWTGAVLGGAVSLGAARRTRFRNRLDNDKGKQ